MKRLLYLVILTCNLNAVAQTFPLRNINDDYLVSDIYHRHVSKYRLYNFVRDKKGLYWFQYLFEVYSFDGLNWKFYPLKTREGIPIRINDIETTDDGNIWLSSSEGMYVFDHLSERFLPISQKYPGIKNVPIGLNNIYHGPPGTLMFISNFDDGFFLFNWKTKNIRKVVLDAEKRVRIKISISNTPIIADTKGNIWGTSEKGWWNYNQFTGELNRSWRGELPGFAEKRFVNISSMAYAEKENSIWISYEARRYIEKMDLRTGRSTFLSFSGELEVKSDTNNNEKHKISFVIMDREDNAWVKVEDRFLVKLDSNIKDMVYLRSEPGMIPFDEAVLRTETKLKNDGGTENNILFWLQGSEKLCMIKKRRDIIKHIYFDTLKSEGVTTNDYNNLGGRKQIFLKKGKNGQYFILQQNRGRPKLIGLDKNFKIRKVLFNDEWKDYHAYFRQDIEHDTFYIAILRPGNEPLDFRNVVVKDFLVDVNELKAVEKKLDFRQRVWRYGSPDINNVYWLYSNGSLFSYDPGKDRLDSIYVCNSGEKQPWEVELIKGYDYPTFLHKASSTFWIIFIADKQLYKINLKTRKVEKILKCCANGENCMIPGIVDEIMEFDTSNIHIQLPVTSILLNTKNHSIKNISELIQKKVDPVFICGIGIYKDWIYLISPMRVYFSNLSTKKVKVFTLGQEFKWRIAQFKSPPLVNENGELILMSEGNKGFLVFDIDSLPGSSLLQNVKFSFIKVDNRNLPSDSLLKNKGLYLKYNSYNTLQVAFSDHNLVDPDNTIYEYSLYKGGDTVWNRVFGKPELTFNNLNPEKYQLLLRASTAYGDYSENITALPIVIIPPFWQTWWFRFIVIAAIGLVLYGLYRYRIAQLKRVQAIRNNIASDLHDDIGSTLNSISIYSEVAKQQAGKEIPALDLIGLNSRKIIESMSDIVWTINPENDSFEKIIIRMRSFAHQLLKAKKVEYSFEVDEKLSAVALPMQVRKNFYLVFKEAVNNVVKYSGATRVLITLTEENKTIILRIRDNGIGIPINAETQGNGLMNMKRRAEEIRANLNIMSNGEGTGIELILKT